MRTIYLCSASIVSLFEDLEAMGIEVVDWDRAEPLHTEFGIVEYIGRIPIPLSMEEGAANYQAQLAGATEPYPQEFYNGIHANVYSTEALNPSLMMNTIVVHPSSPYRKLLYHE